MSAGSAIQPSVKKASTALAPRPSMSKAPRRDEVAELLDRLGRADQVAGAVVHRLAGLADHVGAADRAGLGEGVGDAVRRAAGEVDVLDLRDDVAGAVDRHPVADADVAAVADRVALASRGRRCSRRCAGWRSATTTPPTVTGSRRATGDRAPVRPTWMSIASSRVVARSAENLWASAQRGVVGAEAEAGLQVEAVELVDDAVDVVAEGGALGLDQRGSGRASPRSLSQSRISGLVGKPRAARRAMAADWVSASGSEISPQA